MANGMYHRLLPGILCTAIIMMGIMLPALGADETQNTSSAIFEYKVQEDPFFTVAYPKHLNMTISSADGRNTYHLISTKEPPVTYLFTSQENSDWNLLNETGLQEYEQRVLETVSGMNSKNLTKGDPIYRTAANQSSYFTSYVDNKTKELIYTLVMSTNDNIISAVLTEPAGLYNTDYGRFTLKSLLSLTPRDSERGFTFEPAGNGTITREGKKAITTGSSDKAIEFDPYVGLYVDTDTGYYYLPDYGVFYNPSTGDYYYPKEFGSYESNYFPDYTGTYDMSGGDSGGYYADLYSGYTGTSGGYDASGMIADAYNNRQETYDAANAMWSDYIRGDEYATIDSSGYIDPIDTIQEYKDYDLS
ncbi:MAG TPA: OCRE domain-containing protein [Methanospirillum sp.]|nr:OCRE domain-containing protein [Methanospirillum sp.]